MVAGEITGAKYLTTIQNYMNYISKETITNISSKIAERFNPEKIILFGSYAWGKPEKDSDLDLFVVMESKERPIKRAPITQAHIERQVCPYGYSGSHT